MGAILGASVTCLFLLLEWLLCPMNRWLTATGDSMGGAMVEGTRWGVLIFTTSVVCFFGDFPGGGGGPPFILLCFALAAVNKVNKIKTNEKHTYLKVSISITLLLEKWKKWTHCPKIIRKYRIISNRRAPTSWHMNSIKPPSMNRLIPPPIWLEIFYKPWNDYYNQPKMC